MQEIDINDARIRLLMLLSGSFESRSGFPPKGSITRRLRNIHPCLLAVAIKGHSESANRVEPKRLTVYPCNKLAGQQAGRATSLDSSRLVRPSPAFPSPREVQSCPSDLLARSRFLFPRCAFLWKP